MKLKIFALAAGALVLQVMTWVLRTRAYIACCVPAAQSDPYADLRASSFPGLIIVSSVVVACCLNAMFLFIVFRLRARAPAAIVVDVLRAFIAGTFFISLPIALVAFLKSSQINVLAFVLLVAGPALAGLILRVRSSLRQKREL